MKLIALIGLVSVEKVDLTVELADYFSSQSVTVIDNIARMRIDPALLGEQKLVRFTGDITQGLSGLLNDITFHDADMDHSSDIVLVAVSETVNLENLIVALEDLRETVTGVVTIGLIDLRTCDCFPQTRQVIEQYADIVVNLPYTLADVITQVKNQHG